MALSTKSKFYYIPTEIDTQNKWFDFNEGSGEISFSIDVDYYSPTELGQALEDKLNAFGTKTYTVTFDRTNRTYDIAADSGTYDILIGTGTNKELAFYDVIGLTGSTDLTGAISYTSDSSVGSVYEPQFFLQGYVVPERWNSLTDAAVNGAADGTVEVISFGTTKFTEFKIEFITDIVPQDGTVISSNASGVQDTIDFLEFATKKGNLEFMPDKNTPGTYFTLYLESTSADGKGIGYKLQEETGKNLPGYYKTGNLKWRVL